MLVHKLKGRNDFRTLAITHLAYTFCVLLATKSSRFRDKDRTPVILNSGIGLKLIQVKEQDGHWKKAPQATCQHQLEVQENRQKYNRRPRGI